MKTSFFNKSIVFVFAAPLLVLAPALAGCSREVAAPVAVPVRDTVFLSLVRHDSVFVDHFREVAKMSDTVFVTERESVYRERLKHDTVRQLEQVPVEVVRTETVEVERTLSWWQTLRLSLFPVLLGFSVIVILYWLWRRK